MDAIARDVRGAARSILRRPGFSLLVVGILGLGIGASAAILTIVYVLLVRPLPFKDADRLVMLRSRVGADLGKLALREVQDARTGRPALRWPRGVLPLAVQPHGKRQCA